MEKGCAAWFAWPCLELQRLDRKEHICLLVDCQGKPLLSQLVIRIWSGPKALLITNVFWSFSFQIQVSGSWGSNMQYVTAISLSESESSIYQVRGSKERTCSSFVRLPLFKEDECVEKRTLLQPEASLRCNPKGLSRPFAGTIWITHELKGP